MVKPARPGVALRPPLRVPPWAEQAARAVLAAWVVLAAVPLRYHPITPGLDQSAAFGLNWAAAHGLKHGRDVAFTYGPLGHLTLPMDVGGNLAAGIAFQLAFWLLFSATVAWVALAYRPPVSRLAAFVLLVDSATPLFHNFGSAGPDLFIGFWVLLLLGCALEGRLWALFYGMAAATAVLLLFVKLSSGFQALSAIGMFAAGLLVFDRARGLRAVLLAAAAPVLFVLAYLLYCPSVEGMLRYARATMEIASGYGAAMSEGDSPGGLRAALIFAAVYTLFTGALWLRRRRVAVLALACAGPLFMEFKHAFVRQAGHIEIFFLFVPLVLGVVLLFSGFRGYPWWAAAAAALLFTSFWNHYSPRPASALAGGRALADVLRLDAVRERLGAVSAAALASDRLPAAMLDRIAGRSVTILPWEIAYAAANPLNFRPLPVFGNHQAYTAFLDGWNAAALADPARGPDFVIFDWMSIDDHHPLMEVPATSLALYQHYDVDLRDGPRLLFRRRAAPRFTRLASAGTRRLGLREPLRVEGRGHPVVARIRLRHTLLGRLRRFLYRVPEVRAVLFAEGGRSVLARVPPDVLENGLAVNFTPADAAGAAGLFSRNAGEADAALSLAGPGLAFYEPVYTVDLFEIPEIALAAPSNGPDPTTLPFRGENDAARIEMINGADVLYIGSGEVAEIAPADYLLVRGTALDEAAGGPASAAWLELDGRLYPANYGLPRGEVAAARGQVWRDCGFEWTIPAWKLGGGPHRLSLKAVSRDGSAYFAARRSLRFRLGRRP